MTVLAADLLPDLKAGQHGSGPLVGVVGVHWMLDLLLEVDQLPDQEPPRPLPEVD